MPVSTDFDLYDPAFLADPYPFYAWLRAEAPVLRLRDPDVWLLSRHEDVHAALRSPEKFSSADGVAFGRQGGAGSLIATDAPDHTRLRRVLSQQFTPRSIARLENEVGAVAATLLDGVAGLDSFDFMDLVGAQLPTRVIGNYLGIDPEGWRDYKRWSDMLIEISWARSADTQFAAVAHATVMEVVGFFAGQMAQRRVAPADDLIGRLVTAADRDSTLTDEEVLNFCSLLMLAGNVTTSSALAHAVLLLIEHPHQRAALCEDPDLIPQAIEEIVRFESPVQGFVRTLTQDLELHGERLAAGEQVMLSFASANRDEDAFDDAAVFDITRKRSASVAFGAGPHFCLGAWLARLELREAIAAMLPLMDDWQLAPDKPVTRVPTPAFRDVAGLRLIRR
ncbi:cytochrome P450 [Actinocrispum sp. NPDC049592]|uniref:cytochrome P450 n=1 Tax=Actinocrispum sp. NPDC049592 TaxID=3154835 RepID=UPI003447AB5E